MPREFGGARPDFAFDVHRMTVEKRQRADDRVLERDDAEAGTPGCEGAEHLVERPGEKVPLTIEGKESVAGRIRSRR